MHIRKIYESFPSTSFFSKHSSHQMNGLHGSHEGIARPEAAIHDHVQVFRTDNIRCHLECWDRNALRSIASGQPQVNMEKLLPKLLTLRNKFG